jgi:uncharacterized membrane protein
VGALLALMLLYTAVFSATSILGFRNFGMSAFDIGIHIQAIWKLSAGQGLFNTVRGMPIWGDHCWFVMLLYTPLYWLVPRVETLLILQSTALALGALPLAAIVMRRGGSGFAVLAFALAWLLSPALQNMNLENYHPEVLAAPFLLWAVERADAGKWRGYWIAIAVALLCKEDVALTTFMLGFWVFFKNRRVGSMTMLFSVVWFILCMKVFLPFFNDHGFFRFEGGYWFSQFWQSKFDPGFYWATLNQARVGAYALKLALPILFLFLLNPLLAVAAVPAFMVNVLSGNDYLISIDYHYNFQTLPILFGAAAIGFCQLHMRLGRMQYFGPIILTGMLAAALWANDAWSHLPLKKIGDRINGQYAFYTGSGSEERFRRFADLLPRDPEVPIAASHNLVPHLANRSFIYMFPNPFRAAYWGIEGENLPSVDTIEYLLLDINAIGADNRAILRRLIETEEYRLLRQEGSMLLAQRGAPQTKEQIVDPLQIDPPEDGIRLLAYISNSEVRSLTPLWLKAADIDISTAEMRIPLTTGRLLTAEGLDLGAHDNMRLFLLGQWEAEGNSPVRFRLRADDGCRLYVDGELVVDYEGVHAYSQQVQSPQMQLGPGKHVIALDYFEWGGEAGVQVEWAAVDGDFEVLRWGQTLP